ncbi:MAG: sel1 repeat family protein [Ignavibacteriales bacterium]|nr:sel1 repeat family protein [Ignavibacteriales bacterium]
MIEKKLQSKYQIPIALVLFFFFLFPTNLLAQDSTKSLAFKKNRPYRNNPYFYQPDLSYQILQQFKLVQIANGGDPLAQHELGLRLLTGEGVAADTITAVYWIKKAASQKLTSALYNYGIMLINGWGTEWNPFTAYENFLEAAEAGMSQAQYIIGVLHTDNLIVPRDWKKSYYWIKKSADGGYQPASEVMLELSLKVSAEFRDSVDQNKYALAKDVFKKDVKEDSKMNPSLGLVFIDFDTQTDSVKEFTDKMLISDLTNLNLSVVKDSLSIQNDSLLNTFNDEIKIKLLDALANVGCHEAQTILGKLFETGEFVIQNKLIAAEYFIRATILDSPRAAYLLWQLIREKDFYIILNEAIQAGNPTAQFVWYGLHKLGYDNRLTEKDAIDLLQKAAAQNHIPAIIELGFNYYTDKYLKNDKQKGIEYWMLAEKLSSPEAEVRIAAAKVFESNASVDLSSEISLLEEYEKSGSVLAQFTLGYCYENGIGLNKNLPNAVEQYRNSAQRGNQYAYQQLKRLYDSLRPSENVFKIE